MDISNVGKEEWPYSPEFKKFAEFLGITAERDSKGINWQHNDKTVNKIKTVWEWAKKKAGNEDIIDIMYQVRQYQRQLGGQREGLEALNKIYGYSILEEKKEELAGQQTQVEKEMSLFKEKEENVPDSYRELAASD